MQPVSSTSLVNVNVQTNEAEDDIDWFYGHCSMGVEEVEEEITPSPVLGIDGEPVYYYRTGMEPIGFDLTRREE